MTDLGHDRRFDAAYGINNRRQIVGMFYYWGWFRIRLLDRAKAEAG